MKLCVDCMRPFVLASWSMRKLLAINALTQLKVQAIKVGANGIIDITFDSRGIDTWVTNCWETVQASETAVILK